MDIEIIERAKTLKAELAAFSDYLDKGIDFVKQFYPDQLQFVIENKDKSFDNIVDYVNAEFRKLPKGEQGDYKR